MILELTWMKYEAWLLTLFLHRLRTWRTGQCIIFSATNHVYIHMCIYRYIASIWWVANTGIRLLPPSFVHLYIYIWEKSLLHSDVMLVYNGIVSDPAKPELNILCNLHRLYINFQVEITKHIDNKTKINRGQETYHISVCTNRQNHWASTFHCNLRKRRRVGTVSWKSQVDLTSLFATIAPKNAQPRRK